MASTAIERSPTYHHLFVTAMFQITNGGEAIMAAKQSWRRSNHGGEVIMAAKQSA
jgi:hypothetical protein